MASVPNGVETLQEHFNRLSRAHERYRESDGRAMTYSERKFTFSKNG